MRRTGYRPHDRAWAPRGKVLWLLAAMLATLFFAPLHPLQADEVPQKSTHAFLGAETDNTGEIACSVVPRRPEEGETFTLKFDVTEYTGEHKVFAKYTITKDGSSEKKSGNSNFDYTNNGDVTLQTSVSLDDGNYVFKCHLWEDGSIGWFSSGNVSMEKSDTVNFEVLPPASGDVACDTDPTVPKTGEPFDLRYRVSNYTGSKKVFVKYRRTDSFFDAPGIDTNAAFTDSSGQATITSTNPFNFPIAGTYDYECRLKEQRSGFDRDLTDWQTFRFTVSSAPPTITSLGCSSSTVSLSEGVTCQPRFTGGTPSSYTWRVGGGVTSNAGQRNLSVYWTSTGTKTVSLTATNSDGDDSEPKTYQISVENEEPSVARGWPTASSPRVKASQAYTFSATASDDDGNLSSCQWYIGTSQQPSNECGNFGSYTGSKTATMSFNRASGTHTVRVVFTDSAGRSDEVSWRVTVNRPPEITLVEPTDRTLSIYEGEEIEFRVRAEDDEGNLARWKVDKVGSFLTTSIRSEGNVTDDRSFTGSFSHLFELSLGSAQGTWDITPAFADSLGESASDSWTVTVRPAPDLVLESIDGPIGSVFNDQDINFGVVLKNNGGTATKSFNVSARVTNIASGQETTFEHAGSDPTTLAKGEEISIPPGDTHGTSFTSPDLDGLDSGDYGLCAVATEVGTDAFDSNKSNNEVCKDLYILPGSTGAMPVHLGLTTTDSGRRIWSAVPWETGPDAVRETADAGNFTNEADLKNLYKRLVGELAFRKALEPQNEEAHVWFTGLMESAGSAAKLAGKIYEFCEGANTPCETAIQDTGLDSSGLLRKLPPNAFDFLEDGADFAILFGDAYYSMLVNQALDAQRAQNTLNELGRLPLGPVWKQAISEAREDVAILTTPNNWIAFAAAIEANKEDFIKFAGLAAVKGLTATAIKKHLLQKGLLFTQKAIIHAFGLKVAGGAALTGGAAGTAVAAGSAALFVASVWFATEVYLDVKESHERVGVGSLASFLNAAYYNPADTGDLREALAYANYAAYDNFYESDDTWIQGIAAFDPHKLIASMGHPALLLASLGGSIQGIKDRDEFLEFMSAEREEALEELRELISIQSAQISPASLALTAGQTRELDLEATTRSGKSASTQEFVWSSSASRVATVSGDGTVTGVGPGSATITARADGVSATADVVVEAAPVDNSCTNGVAVIDPDNNPGLVADCRALLLLRDAWGGASSLNWQTGVPITGWQGVQLSRGETRVIGLAPKGRGLAGNLPTALYSLTELTTLDLSNNSLTGSIPRDLDRLQRLENLIFADNNLTNPIPGRLGQLPSLQVLDLRNNDLTGSIPDQLQSLSDTLTSVYLSGNSRLDSCVGEWLFQVATNDLISANLEICEEITDEVTWGFQGLTASPRSIGSAGGAVIASAVTVDGSARARAPTFAIGGPGLTGATSKAGVTCGVGRGTGLASGERCWEASFTLPNNDTAAERTYSISVSSSQITSQPPAQVTVTVDRPGTQIGDRGVLMALYNATDGPNWRAQQGWMSSNPIGNWRGVVTDANGNVTQLILDGYGLNGRIPPELGNLSSLTRLILNNNTLTELPPELGKLSNLTLLDINYSNLSGPIPPELGNLSNLDRLTLQQNQMTGPIPPELGNLANLTLLRLSGNQLTGCVPAALQSVSNNDFRVLNLPFCDDEPTGPQSGDRVYVTSGTLNGQHIDTARPSITVSAGEVITGTVNLDIHNDHFAGAVFPVEATPNWGDHARSYWRVPISVPAFGSTSGNARVNLTAPATPREYAIIFVAQAELSRGYVASATHWPSGRPRWDNGDDVASWDAAKIDYAIENGYVLAPQHGWDQANAHFGAAAIKVVVTAGGQDSNCLQGILCYTSNPVQHAEAAATIRHELGENWVIADWNDLKSLWPQRQEEMKEFLHRGGRVNVNGDAQWGSTGRWYFIEDHDGSKPGFFLAHDELGGHEISLGSWFFDEAYYLAIESTEEEDDDEQAPDLVVESPSVSDSNLETRESFTFSATVRNQGDGTAPVTTLRYYRSTDSSITPSDALVDTDSVNTRDAGETSDESVRMAAPTSAGTYYIGACVDAVPGESNTQNNCSNGVEITVTGFTQATPDLVVQSASTDKSNVNAGGSLTLSATVRNQGDGTSTATTLRYYRSTSRTISRSDVAVGTDAIAVLGASGSSPQFIDLTAPDRIGTYYYGACVDEVAIESNTQNNCSADVKVEIKPVYPDLVVESPTVDESNLETGGDFRLTVTVRNQGDNRLGATTTLRYLRSTDSTITTSDTEVGTDDVNRLKPSSTDTESINLDAPATAGTYYYGACVDSVTGESDTTNNCSGSVEVTATQGNPDLLVESPSVDESNPAAGTIVRLRVTAKNQGDRSSPATTVRFYRSTDSTISSGDTEVATDSVRSLEPSQTSNESIDLTAPANAGTYYYGACVDPVTGESDTGNNCSASVTVTVTGTTTTAPDLVVESPSVDDKLLDPDHTRIDDFRLTVTVRNQGDGASPEATLRYYRSTDSTITTSDTQVDTDIANALTVSETDEVSTRTDSPTSTGTYFYGACIDSVSRESNTGNNCSTGVEVIVSKVGVGNPDLVVESPTVSSDNVAAGMSLTVGATVRNQGTGRSPDTDLRYYRSTDSTITTSDTEVDSDGIDTLGPTETTTASDRLLAPGDAGTYYFGACVESVARESNTQNNCSGGVAVTVTGSATVGPDLVVESPTVEYSRVAPDETFRIDVTVRNQGNVESLRTTLSYYRSTDSTITTSDTEVDTDTVFSLDPSESAGEYDSPRTPETEGIYYYGACVDSVADETDTTNNCSAGVQVTVIGPDLVVESPSVNDSSLDAGESFTLSVTVRNQGGEGERASSTDLRYYRSTDSSISTSDTEVGTDSVNSLASDATSPESITLTAPATDGTSTYYYGACVDSETDESVTNNNCSSGVAVTVTGESQGSPDLVVQSPSVSPSSLGTGDSFTLSATVRNDGDAISAATTLRYYRSSDSTITSGDTEVGTDSVGGLAESGTEAESLSLTAPSSSGTYYYGACVDSVSGESDTTNNCSAGVEAIVESIGNFDMVVSSFSVRDTEVATGGSIRLTATVRNDGTGRSISFALRYYLSTDSTISDSDTRVAYDQVNELNSSKTSRETTLVNAPSDAGTYYYGACIPLIIPGELNTQNNCTSGVRVTVN